MGPKSAHLWHSPRLYLELVSRVPPIDCTLYLDPGIYGFVRCKACTSVRASNAPWNECSRGVDNGIDNNSFVAVDDSPYLLMIINDVTVKSLRYLSRPDDGAIVLKKKGLTNGWIRREIWRLVHNRCASFSGKRLKMDRDYSCERKRKSCETRMGDKGLA